MEGVTNGWGMKAAGCHTAGRRRCSLGPESCSPSFGCAAQNGALHQKGDPRGASLGRMEAAAGEHWAPQG